MAEDSPARRDSRPRTDEPEHRTSGSDVGWGITGTLLSGIIVWGGVGLALDRWWGTRFVVLIGVILGLAVAIYLVVVKYGAVDPPPAGRRPTRTSTGSTASGRRSRSATQDQTQKGQR